MAIQNSFPAFKPTLLLDFAKTKRLDPRITFARTTTATYYDGDTVAKAEENLATYSQEFDNAEWVKTSLSVTANDTTAPDGTSTADKFTDDATSAAHRVVGTYLGLVGSTTYAFSAFLKKGTNNFAYIGFRDGATNNRYIAAAFNLDTGVAGDTFNPGSGTLVGSTITNIGNGWYRCSVIGSLSGTSVTTPQFIIGMSTAATGISLGGFLGEAYVGTGSTIYAWGAQLEQRSSVTAYTATTTQPITNYIPVLLTAPAGAARFDHNPVTEDSLGLLIEEQRTNLLTYSAEFDNAAWTKSNASITSNTIVAPDGTLTGDQLVENTSTGQHRVYRSVSGTTNTNPYTYSFFAKASTRTRVYIGILEGATFVRQGNAVFDLSTGAIVSVSTGINGASGGSATIQNVGNGWYRCTYTLTLGGTDTSIFGDINLVSTGTTISYTGNGYAGVFIWGAQLEAGAFPTSYIPTVAATVTRNADAASMTGSNFTSWFNNAEGTLYAEGSTFANASASRTFIQIDDTTTSNRIMINRAISSSIAIFTVTVAGVAQADIANGGAIADGSNAKMVGAYQVNNFAFSFNANSVSTDTSGTIPVVRQMLIGSRSGATNFLNGTIKKLAYYPLRVTNAQLQALTS